MSKTDQILEHVIRTEVKVGAIEEHLKNLNGTIKSHDKDIKSLNKRVWIAYGGIITFITLLGLAIKFL